VTPVQPPAPPSTPLSTIAGSSNNSHTKSGASPPGLEMLQRAVADLTPRAQLAQTLAHSVQMLQVR
jgi:hypothetical protein